ncbi:MAG: hypothetical protein WAL22_10375 [Solirubrobacteraceae bacterium]
MLNDGEIRERWGDHLLRPLMPLLEELLSGATNEAAHLRWPGGPLESAGPILGPAGRGGACW